MGRSVKTWCPCLTVRVYLPPCLNFRVGLYRSLMYLCPAIRKGVLASRLELDMLKGSLNRIGTMFERGGAKHMCYLVGFVVFVMVFLYWLVK